jgi:hypothetical protein
MSSRRLMGVETRARTHSLPLEGLQWPPVESERERERETAKVSVGDGLTDAPFGYMHRGLGISRYWRC